MVSIPSGVNVPGADKATIDIAAKLKAMPDVSCGWGSKPVYIVAIAKPKNTLLPLYVPVSGATIEGRVLSVGLIEVKKLTTFANLDGITSACVPILPTVWYEFRAKQYNVDFGNGTAVFSNWKSVKDVVVFEGKIDIPCPVISPIIGVSGFDKLTSAPKISTQPLNIPFSGYGTIPMSGDYEIKINTVSIKTGKVVDGKVDFTFDGNISNLLTKLYIPPALPPTTATIELIIKMGTCTFKKSILVNLPKPVTLPCIGNFVQPNMSSLLSGITNIATIPSSLIVPLKLTGDKTSVPFEIWIGGIRIAKQPIASNEFDLIKIMKDAGISKTTSQFYVTIKSLEPDCKIPDLVIPVKLPLQIKLCDPPKIPSPITGECITPSVPECSKFITTAETPSHPSGITDISGTFYLFINKIIEECKSDPSIVSTKIPKGTDVGVTLGSLGTMHIPLTSDGQFNEDLSKYFNFKLLAGAIQITPTKPETLTPSKQKTPAAPTTGEKIGLYCELKQSQSLSGQVFYDVVHDTLGKIYSGNTYDQAKYKAQNDERCTLTAAQISSNEYTPAQWNAMNAQQMYDAFKKGFAYRTYYGTIFNYACNTCSPNVPPGFSDSRPAGSSVYTYKGYGTSTKSLDEAWRIYIKSTGGSP